MSTTPFVIPEGLVLSQQADGLSIEHTGTIELHATLGGPISRLVSTGGDIVLHLPLEIGHVEAAGAVRATADLEAGTLVGDEVHVAGDLRARTLRSQGQVEVGGNLDGGEIHCAGLRCTELSADTIDSQGAVETSGDVKAARLSATDFRSGGDAAIDHLQASGEVGVIGSLRGSHVSADALTTGGDVAADAVELQGQGDVGGALSAQRVSCAGGLEVAGHVGVEALEVGGNLRAAAGVTSGQVAVLGALSTGGDLTARSVQASGLSVGGGMQISEKLSTDGALEIGGDVAINELSAGDLTLGGKVLATRLVASGTLTTRGEVQADRLSAGTVRIESGSVRVKVIEASNAVHVGPVKVRSDIIIAPTVSLDPGASGRVSVVESLADVGPSKIKGCLSLEDLDDLFGNADQFLADRKVARLGEAPVAAGGADLEMEIDDSGSLLPEDEDDATRAAGEEPMLEPEIEDSEEVEAVEEVDAEEDEADEETRPEDGAADEAELDAALEDALESVEGSEVDIDISVQLSGDSPAEQAAAAEVVPDNGSESDDLFGWADQMLHEVVAQDAIHHPDAEQETGGVAAVRVDDAVPPEAESEELIEEAPSEALQELAEVEELEEEDPAAQDDDPLHGQMQDTINRIVTCYVHSEMPPAVTRLRELVEARDYGRIRADITDIWNQLLKFHQKRGMRIQPQVTTTFNTINSLVRKL